MPVITRLELENAQRDVEDLGKIVNGAADVPNPGQAAPNNFGTVTTRLNRVVKTLAKLVADGQATVEARLTPEIYTTTLERMNDLVSPDTTPGKTCFDKEDNNLYICLTQGDPPEKYWHQVSNLQLSATADLDQLLRLVGPVGRISIEDHKLVHDVDKLYENDALTKHHIEFPGKSTLSEGLAKSLNYNSWPTAHMGQKGVDYGCRIPEASLVLASAPVGSGGWVDWDNTIKRAHFRNNNPNRMSGYHVLGYIDINSTYDRSVYLEDCIIDPNFAAFQAIGKANPDAYALFCQYCDLKRFLNEASAPNFGHIAYCDIENSRGDGLKASGHDVTFHGNMIRLLGQITSAHADGIQVFDCDNLQITQNTIYMPGTATVWDEGAYGTTQCLRLVTESAANALREVYVAGNLFVGGGFTVAVRSRFVGSVVENVAIVNNLIGGKRDGNPYWVYGPITKEHWLSQGSIGTIRNVLMWNNRMTDGTSFATELPGVPQGGADQNGIWHFSKEHASPRWLEIGKRLGLLDWNGDLASGVVNRTDGP